MPGGPQWIPEPEIRIYEFSFSYLKQARNAVVSGQDSGEVARLQGELESEMSLMQGGRVGAVVRSIRCRKLILELSAELGLENESSLRAALRADEEHVSALLASVVNDEKQRTVALSLEGDSAQSFLDAAQDAVDRGYLIGQEQIVQRVIRKLSESCDRLPSSLFITGVTDRGDRPTFGGAFGDIYRASYDNKPVALKQMRHFVRGSESRDLRLKFCREALLWQELHHPNILPFLGIDRESLAPSLCLVSPWMKNGTVLSFLKDHGHKHVNKLLHDIAQGLEYLHSRNIVHGDLRGSNILVAEDWRACLADFGLSIFADVTAATTSNRAGSLRWMAPELMNPDQFGCRFIRTPASDVYAFGCVCFEIYTGKPPFAELSEPATLFKVLKGERAKRPPGPPSMSDIIWMNVTSYWAENPAARPSIKTVVEHMAQPQGRQHHLPLPRPQSTPSAAQLHTQIPIVPAFKPNQARKEGNPRTEVHASIPSPLKPTPVLVEQDPDAGTWSKVETLKSQANLKQNQRLQPPLLPLRPQRTPPGVSMNQQSVTAAQLQQTSAIYPESWEVFEQYTPPPLLLNVSLSDRTAPFLPMPSAIGHSLGLSEWSSTLQRPLTPQAYIPQKTLPATHFQDIVDPTQHHTGKQVHNGSDKRVSENGYVMPPQTPSVVKEKKGGFWGRWLGGDSKEKMREQGPSVEMKHEALEQAGGRQLLDEEELARKIGFLTATASEDWTVILDVCDLASSSESCAKEATRSLRREFKYGQPTAQLAAARLWAILLRNSSDNFIRQCTSRKFLDTLEDLLTSSRTAPVVRERVMSVLGAAAYASASNTVGGYRGLWKRVKPEGTPEEGVPFDADDDIFSPPISAGHMVASYNSSNKPMSPLISSDVTPQTPEVPASTKVKDMRDEIIPLDEDMWRLFQECTLGRSYAWLLSDSLIATTPDELDENIIIQEFHMKCLNSQELINTQILWALAGAERSQRTKDGHPLSLNPHDKHSPQDTSLTQEEELLGEVLAANEKLTEALMMYDDRKRAAVEQGIEGRGRTQTRPNQLQQKHSMEKAALAGESASRARSSSRDAPPAYSP